MTVQIYTRVRRSYEEGAKDIVLYENESASKAIQWAVDHPEAIKDGDYMRVRKKVETTEQLEGKLDAKEEKK